MSGPHGEEILQGRLHEGGDLTLDCDVVVVGSGAGGAVVAHELTAAGQRVIVLEEGPYVPARVYARYRPSQSIRHLWRDGAMTAAFGLGGSPLINMTMGRCVGGSSVLTGGVCFRVPGSVLDVWRRERGLTGMTEAALEPAYRAVEEACHVEGVPVDMRSRSTALFGKGLESRGLALKPIRRNTRGCNGCGQCNFGCPCGAKMSVDVSYLPRALAGGARIVSDCLVQRVVVEGDRAAGVRGRLLDERGRKGARVEVRARRVVLSCGSVHTPLLLLRSGLGRAGTHIGRHMTLHPGFRMLARFDEPVRGWAGSLQSAWSDAWEHDRVTAVGLFVPPSVLAATMAGFGPRHAELAADIPNIAMMGALIHDDGGGRVRRGPGREPIVTYRMSKADRAAIPTLVRELGETFFAAGAKQVYPPILGLPPVDADGLRKLDVARIPANRIECSSQHPLGTCRMGPTADSSVVDPEGRVWGVRELYVADGSVVPTSLGVNPQLTIMTLATHLAWKMRQRALS